MKNTVKIFALCSLLFALCSILLVPQRVLAQLESVGLATYLTITDSKVQTGQIVVTSKNGYSLSTIEYDQAFVGVVNTEPAISIRTEGQRQGYPVINAGSVQTQVIGINGSIKKGDYIATSTKRGVGVKAVHDGFVIGQAISSVSFRNKNEVKIVQVTINPHLMTDSTPGSSSIFNFFKTTRIAAYEKPSKTLQYVLAAFITIITFGCGFFIFAKAVNTGIEALGRNPLAGRMIQLSLVFNLLMIVVIVIVGTGLAYLVLRL